MLLIDDGQGQVFEFHQFLNDRMRAHHQGSFPRLNQGQHFGAFFFLLTAREPGHANTQRSQPAHQFSKVLLRQNFGRSHKGALPTLINGQHSGQSCHHGFASAYVALKQAVHGHRTRQVLRNFKAHPLLCGRELERQNLFQFVMPAARLWLEGGCFQSVAL